MYDLKALQEKEIENLQAIHDACEKMGLSYVIMHGTLIGAVRHQGFIPWDDDIDICMPREDYDAFIRDGEKYLPDHLRIQHVDHERECPNIFAKVRDRNTTFLHEEHVDLDISQGVFIDIFPLDRIKKSKRSAFIECLRRRIFNLINECYDLAYIGTIKRKTSRIIGLAIHYGITRGVMRFRKRWRFISKEEDRRRKMHRRGDDWTFISIYRNITGPYSWFTDRVLYPFQGRQFYGPRQYDAVLSALYGDYMTIPPKDQQITHQPLFVDLEHGYTAREALRLMNGEKKENE